MKTNLILILSALSMFFVGNCALAQRSGSGGSGSFGGNTGGGGFNTGGSGFNTGGVSQFSTGGSGGSGGGNSSSLFNSGGSSSQLFNSGNSSTSNSSSSGTSGGGAGGSGSLEAQTTINTGQIGAATPITRGPAIERNNTGSFLINSNPDIVGGQPLSGGNQFSNLFSQIGRQLNQGGNFNQQGGRATQRSTIRIPLRLGFVPKPISVPQFTAKFESRIANLPGITAVGPIRVTMEGSTAVLRGVVASEQDREMAEGVALLEPEVGSVRNELTVQGVEAGSATGADSLFPAASSR